ncbi:MAG TPA: UDP-N-acetylglucosamine--N-acetylmuramyl-(pentapeptide) pyrophosphoryl-undecaprenol N-acetylglucosamine transferase [Aggregatilineales bacterium]|nr:UDP-N-acetylglucosamine--N-acetylmuramyl-(pentapeptide) pyrophosphoryl-undecaprenol N-acetylglucosamine transferase [Aggregatilineales bacterium]
MSHPSTILISAGGTGGGIYPALAVAEGLYRCAPDCRLHFVGGIGGMERGIVAREQQNRPLFVDYHEVQSGPLHGVNPLRIATSLGKLAIGLFQGLRLVDQIKPDVLFLTGGWATFPVAVACWLRRVPLAMFLPDIEPALAIKTLSRLARVVMTTTAESVTYFPHGTTVLETGYPLRDTFATASRETAIGHFALDPKRKTLLVLGGSRGARSINEALLPIVPELVAAGLQILHVTGDLDWRTVQERRERLTAADKSSYRAFPYLHQDMALALAAGDLVVSRAGASVLGEFPYFSLPSILVPYPFAWRYQKINADWLVARGAALRLDDSAMRTELLPTILGLVRSPSKRAEMRRAAAALARQDAAGDIARRVIALAGDAQDL